MVPKVDGLRDRIALQPCSGPQFRVPAIPIRNVDQTGDLADEGVFITSQDAIRIGDLPQHLDNANTFFVAEIVDHDLGEMKKVRRLKRTFFRRLYEPNDLIPAQAEPPRAPSCQ